MKKRIFLIICLTIAAFYSFSCIKEEKKEMSVSFTGDIIMHIPVKTSARQHDERDTVTGKTVNNSGFDFLFSEIRPVLKKSDIVVGNMEFPVAPPYTSRPWIFNCPPAVIPALKNAGFTAVTLANNHMLDQGPEGAVWTIRNLKKNGLAFIGTGETGPDSRDGLIAAVNGISVGMIGYTGVTNYPLPRNSKSGITINWFYDEEKVKEDIASIKAKCDYVVMVVHTGVEYEPLPRDEDRALMKKYLDEGADLIIGHHPHVVQPVEKHMTPDGRETCIFYSLGNFISNQSDTDLPENSSGISTRESIIVTVNLEKKKDTLKSSFTVTPVMTRNTLDRKTWTRVIQAAPYDENIKVPETMLLAETPGPEGTEKTSKYMQVLNRSITTSKVLAPPENGHGSNREI